MPPQDRRRNQLGNLRRLIATRFDRMQRVEPQLLSHGSFFRHRVVPRRNPRIQIPAVEVDARAVPGQIRHQLLHAGQIQRFEVNEPHHHIGNLDAGIVDIVLHIDLLSSRNQQPHESITQNCVAQMPDVCRLVGIDARVLHQRMQRLGWRGNHATHSECLHKTATVETRIDVSSPRQFQRRKSRNATQRRHNLFGNSPWCFAQLPRQLKSNRRGVLAEGKLRRLLQHHRFHFDLVQTAEHSANPLRQLSLLFQIHADVTDKTFEKSLILSAARSIA